MNFTFAKLLITCGILVSASGAIAQQRDNDRTCRTTSRGFAFTGQGRNASAEAVNACERYRFTSSSECRRNLVCRVDRDDRNDNRRDDTELSARFRNCQRNNICSYEISWRTDLRRRQSLAITVQLVGEDASQRLFACSDRDGSQRADWIQPGKRYVFRAYETRDCRAALRYDRPVETIQIVHRR